MSVFREDVMKGKAAMITGGGSGIGLGIATTLVSHGGQVCISGRREEVLKEAVAQLNKIKAGSACYQVGDVRDFDSCKGMAAKCAQAFGRIDLLVNNAAGNFTTAMEDLSPKALKTVMEIDFHGSYNMSQACLSELKKTQGLVVNISATLYYKVFPFQMHASAAKAAIDVMTNSMGVEWGAEHKIRAVSIAPGPIEGTVGGPTGRVFGGMGDLPKDVSHMVPIGRFGTVDDIANCVLFLATPAGGFINATKIVVDGGHWHEASDLFLKGRQFIQQKSSSELQGRRDARPKL